MYSQFQCGWLPAVLLVLAATVSVAAKDPGAPIELSELAPWEEKWKTAGAEIRFGEEGRIFQVETPAEIRRVMRNDARPGDVLVMANGEWKDAELVFEGKGEPGRPITLRAEEPGKVLLTGGSRLSIGGSHLVVDGLHFRDGNLKAGAVIQFRTSAFGEATNCRLTNSAITDYNPADPFTSYHWINLFGRENRIDHNRFSGQDHAGRMITLMVSDEPNYHRIDRNHFGPRIHRDPDSRRSGGAIIMIGHSFSSMHDSRTLVEYNYFENCSGHGEILSNKSNENVYRHNTIVDSRGALTLRHGDRCVVYGNAFLGNGGAGTGGVRIINAGHRVEANYFERLAGAGWTPPLGIMSGQVEGEIHEYFPARDSLIKNNVFVECRRPVVLGLGSERPALSVPPQNIHFSGNVFHGGEGPLFEVRAPPVGLKWTENRVVGVEPGIDGGAGLAVSGASTASPPSPVYPLVDPGEVGPSWFKSDHVSP